MYNLCYKMVIGKILLSLILPFADALKLVSFSHFFQCRVIIGELIYLFGGKRFSSPFPSLSLLLYSVFERWQPI